MTPEVRLTCPLGAQCEEIRDGAIHRCVWFTQLQGTNPQTGDRVDERGCAMVWLPILLIENAQQARSTSAAVESFRNEMVEANQAALPLLLRNQ